MFKLCQYTTLLPFNYDTKSETFKPSKFLKIYSIILLSIILVFGIFSSMEYIQIMYSKTYYFNYIDLMCIIVSFTLLLLIQFLILKEKISHIVKVIEMFNSMLVIDKIVKIFAENKKFIKYLRLHIILEILIFPIGSAVFNLVISGQQNSYKQSTILIMVLSLTIISSSIHIWYFAFRILFIYLDFALVKFMENLNKIDQNSKEMCNKVRQLSDVYHKITKIMKSFEQQYGTVFILNLIGIYFSIVWQMYQCMAFIFFATQVREWSIILALLYMVLSLLLQIRSSIFLQFSIVRVLKRDEELRVLINNILVTSSDYQLHQVVSY